jgi:hypothetical protein
MDTSRTTTSRSRRYAAGAALALSSVLVLGACGDDDEGNVENELEDVGNEVGELGEDTGDAIEDGTDDMNDDGSGDG